MEDKFKQINKMNTYVRDYKVNYHEGEYHENIDAHYIFTDLAMQVVEYKNSLNVLHRMIAIAEKNDLKNSRLALIAQEQVWDGERWIDVGGEITRYAHRSEFINTDTGEYVSFSDAIEADPNDESKTVLKTGYKTVFDYALGLVGEGLMSNHDYHKYDIYRIKEIQGTPQG